MVQNQHIILFRSRHHIILILLILISHLFYFCNSENDRAFDILYCITFKLMDQQWLDMHATYMDFNV